MSEIKKKNVKVIFIHFAYWTGIVIDLLSAISTTIYMLAPNETFINTIMKFPPLSEGTFVILITETALMWGWTALLFWADRKPIERRGVLLLTLAPVLAIVIANTSIGLIQGNPHMSYIRLFLIAVFVIVLIGFILAEVIARKTKEDSSDSSPTV